MIPKTLIMCLELCHGSLHQQKEITFIQEASSDRVIPKSPKDSHYRTGTAKYSSLNWKDITQPEDTSPMRGHTVATKNST